VWLIVAVVMMRIAQGVTAAHVRPPRGLSAGDISSLHNIDGVLVRFRVTELIETPAKPLAEVRQQIRKSLAPVQLKKSIQREAELLKRDREIERYAMD